MLKFGGLSVPMLSTNPPDPYSIAKSLIFIVTVNPKLEQPPTSDRATAMESVSNALEHQLRAQSSEGQKRAID